MRKTADFGPLSLRGSTGFNNATRAARLSDAGLQPAGRLVTEQGQRLLGDVTARASCSQCQSQLSWSPGEVAGHPPLKIWFDVKTDDATHTPSAGKGLSLT